MADPFLALVERIRRASKAERRATDIREHMAAIEEMRHAASELADLNPSTGAEELAGLQKLAGHATDYAADLQAIRVILHGRTLSTDRYVHTVGNVVEQVKALAEDHALLHMRNAAAKAKRFPVLADERGAASTSVPWSLVEPLRASCKDFHDQTLERLAERGGLSRGELYAHVHAVAAGRRVRMADFKGQIRAEVDAWFATWSKP